MWGFIGITFMILALVAVLRLEFRIGAHTEPATAGLSE